MFEIVGVIRKGEDFLQGLKRICEENISKICQSGKDHFGTYLLNPDALWILVSIHNSKYPKQKVMASKVIAVLDSKGFRISEPNFILMDGSEVKIKSAVPDSDVAVSLM